MNEWLAWAWVIGVDLAVIVAAVFATYERAPLAALRPQHIAAATIVALAGWEAAINVVSSAIGPNAFLAADIAFLTAQAIFAIAAGVLVLYVLRRRRWAVVLGIGLASARFVLAAIGIVDVFGFAESMDQENFRATLAFLALGAMPMLVAVWLFVDPFLRGELAWRAVPDAVAPDPDGTPVEGTTER